MIPPETHPVSADALLAALDRSISAHQPDAYKIVLEREGYRQEGEYWYFVVHPTDSNVRASEYAQVLATIENEIEREYHVDVLLVPTIIDE